MSIFKLNNRYVTTVTSSTPDNEDYVGFCNYGGGFVNRMSKSLF